MREIMRSATRAGLLPQQHETSAWWGTILTVIERSRGMIDTNSYQPKQFNLSGLNGISDRTLEMHFKLYEGYVKETNNLSDRISEFLKDGKVDQEEVPAYSELTRR